MEYLPEEEIKRQRLVLNAYKTMSDLDYFGKHFYGYFKHFGVAGIEVRFTDNHRDLFMRIKYDDGLETAVVFTAVDVYGSDKNIDEYRKHLRSELGAEYGGPYYKLCRDYDRKKKENPDWNKYDSDNNVLLENWVPKVRS